MKYVILTLIAFFTCYLPIQAQQPTVTTRVDLKEQNPAPASPAATFWRLYVDTTGAINVRSSAGVITTLGTLGNTINLQASTPGVAQSGHLNISGTAIANTFSGVTFTASGLVTGSNFVRGGGSPEGVVTAIIGTEYRDTTNGYSYTKMSGAGNTGWIKDAISSETVTLQSSTPGTTQSGHWNIGTSGTGILGLLKQVDAIGTDQNGTDLLIKSGASTGEGYSGKIKFFVSPSGPGFTGAGSSSNPFIESLIIENNGSVTCDRGLQVYRNYDYPAAGLVIGTPTQTTEKIELNGALAYLEGITASVPTPVLITTGATVTQPTAGNTVLTLKSTATNDDPTAIVVQNRIAVTDATVTTIHTWATTSDTSLSIEATVLARRTGGAAGASGDTARYKIYALFKNVSGTVTQVGSTTVIFDESQSAWDCTFSISGTDVLLRFTGAASNNVTVHMNAETMQLGS